MNIFSNAVLHPRTSAAGMLIGVVGVTSILSQQGITLGNAGSGTVVSLLASVASAFLGLLAQDPGAAPAPATAQKNQ